MSTTRSSALSLRRGRGERPRARGGLIAAAAAALLLAPLLFAPTAASAATPGAPEDHPITVVLALGKDYPLTENPDEMVQRAKDQIEELRQYWLQQTGGKVDIRLESVEWADVNNDGATDDDALCYVSGSQAQKRVGDAQKDIGWVSGPRRHFFYLVVAGCRNDGTGSTGSTRLGLQNGGWLDGAQGGPNPTVYGPISHEMGHNFSLLHADTYVCADGRPDGEPVAQGGTCSSNEYADGLELMSGALGWQHKNISAANSVRVGMLNPDEYLSVTGDFEQQVTIQTRDLHTGVRAIRITDPISRRDYYVEFTSEHGRNAGVPEVTSTFSGVPYEVTNGVRMQRVMPTNHTVVLAAPVRADGTHHFSWLPGQTFVSPTGGITVDVVSRTDTTATLKIRTRADVVAPEPAKSLAADGSTVSGTAEPLSTVKITDPNGTLIGTATASATGAFTTTVSPAQAPGTVLSTTVTDAAGNVSGPATVAVPAIPVTPPEVRPVVDPVPGPVATAPTLKGTASSDRTVKVLAHTGIDSAQVGISAVAGAMLCLSGVLLLRRRRH